MGEGLVFNILNKITWLKWFFGEVKNLTAGGGGALFLSPFLPRLDIREEAYLAASVTIIVNSILILFNEVDSFQQRCFSHCNHRRQSDCRFLLLKYSGTPLPLSDSLKQCPSSHVFQNAVRI